MPLALIFDVETTGLLPKNNGAPLSEFPNIIQFSFVLYDTEENKIKKVYNKYILPINDVKVSQEITNITGITQEIIDSEGIHICEAIQEFFHIYMEADVLVGHNLEFDIKMVLAESARWGLNIIIDTFEKHCHIGKPANSKQLFDTSNTNFYCTMMNGIEICKLERTNSRGTYFKHPKLSELYQHIFETNPPEGLHNSLIDVFACLRCYVAMDHYFYIGDEAFEEILQHCV